MTRAARRQQLIESRAQVEREREALEKLRAQTGMSQEALDAAQRRQPLVESLVGFLVGKREQNGFGRDYRITSYVPRPDERHA